MADDVVTSSPSAVIDDLERELPQTPSARPRRPIRRVLSFVAGFLVVVLGAELGVRLVQRHLPQPNLYFSDVATTDINSMDRLRAAGIHSDLTFVGTSMVRQDVDANLV